MGNNFLKKIIVAFVFLAKFGRAQFLLPNETFLNEMDFLNARFVSLNSSMKPRIHDMRIRSASVSGFFDFSIV